MTTRRWLGGLLVVMTVTVAVARTRQAGGDDRGVRAFSVTGVVTAAPADGQVMIAHQEVPGYMPAMTMPFALAPGDTVPPLTPGDRVRFTLSVGALATEAGDFEVVGHDTAIARALRGGRPSPQRLRKGDVLPDVSLVSQADTPFTTTDLRGHVTAVTFIFTRCPMPEFCPLMVKRFQQVQKAIAADPSLAQARLLAVTLDPAFDSPDILAAYADAMQADPARWRFATGTPEAIARLTQAFAIHVERNGVLLDHTLATAVIDADGRVAEIWRGNGWTPDDVVAALRSATSAAE